MTVDDGGQSLTMGEPPGRSLNVNWRSIFRIRAVIQSLLVVLMTLQGTGLAFCVAEDGHITVEATHLDRQCLADFERHHPGASCGDELEQHQHSCVDVVLSEQPLRSTVDYDLAASLASVPSCAAAPLPANDVSWSCSTAASVAHSQRLAPRTVVLIV